MPDTLVLYDLAPSPNNIKVRIALNYKGLPFTKIPVDPQNRSEVIKVSTQPLTPVLVHDDRVVFDSGAILRYLDANFPATPRLFSTDYDTMHEIERWEGIGRREMSEPVEIVFEQFFKPKKDPSELERASRLLHDHTGVVEKRLAGVPWLVWETMTAADVTLAPMIWYGMLSPAVAALSPLHKFFAEGLSLGSGREKTRAWVTKVMSHDRP